MTIRSIFLYFLVTCVFRINSEENTNYATVMNSSHDNESLQNGSNTMEFTSKQQIFLPPDIQKMFFAIESLTNGKCKNDSKNVLEAVVNRQKWALQMFDSSPKFPVGLLHGSYFQLGNYDECISTVQPDSDLSPIKGQYCLAEVDFHKHSEIGDERYARSNGYNYKHKSLSVRMSFNDTLQWAICVPSSCSRQEVVTFLHELFRSLISVKDLSINIPERNCHFETPLPVDSLEIVYGTVMGIFFAVLILATVYHMSIYGKSMIFKCQINHPNNGQSSLHREIILSFSAIKSIHKILHIKTTSDFDFDFISGLKVLSMFLVVTSHTLVFVVGGPVMNEDFYLQAVKKPQNAIFVNNPLLVDSFLLIGAFLMGRLLLLEFEKRKGKVNVIFVYLGRYIRLTPAYLVIIGFYCTVFPRLDSGPLWAKTIMTERDRCLKSWWTNILYINNYVNTDSICMFQSWYLSADMHLFMIAPLIIYPLWRWPRKGEIFLGISTSLAVLIPFIVTYVYKLDPTLMGYPSELSDITTNRHYVFSYIKTHMRAAPYFVGLVGGYIVHRLQTTSTKLSKIIVVVGWITSTAMGLTSVISIIVFYQDDYKYNALESAMYAALHKLAWSFFIVWIIIACVTDNSGPIKKFLSYPAFIPLSRLTYCAYLVNGLIELHAHATLRSPIYMSVYHMTLISLSHLVLTFFVGFLLCVMFESPIHSVEKILLKRERRPVKQDSSLQGSDH